MTAPKRKPAVRWAVLAPVLAAVVAGATVAIAAATQTARPPATLASASASAAETPADCTGTGPEFSEPAGPGSDRLRSTYETRGYLQDPTSGSLDAFRVDPAPAVEQPRLTSADVLAKFSHGRAFTAEQHPTARSGLFTGGIQIVGPGPNHELDGTPTACVPAWLVLVENVVIPDLGPPVSEPPGTPQPPRPEQEGTVSFVLNDADGSLLSNEDLVASTHSVP